MEYPQRDAFFSNRYIRLLTRTCAAYQLGSNGMILCMIIAMQEDVIRYTRPVSFHRGPLQDILGIARWESLNAARQKAVTAGWLYYENKGKRQAGIYWVTIPPEHQDLLDAKGDAASDNGPKQKDSTAWLLSLEDRYREGYNTGYRHKSLSLPNRYNASDSHSDKASDNTSDLSNLTPVPTEPSPIEPEKFHVEQSDTDSGAISVSSESKKSIMTPGQLGLIVSLKEHEMQMAQDLCDLFDVKYIRSVVYKIRQRKQHNGDGDLVWLSEVSSYIRKHPPHQEQESA